jgi:hypothetical protein
MVMAERKILDINISVEEERALSVKIVRDFGNGILKDGYVFDQIVGSMGKQVRLSEALRQISVEDVIVMLDRHPNNRTFAERLMDYLGISQTWAFVVPNEQLLGILGFIDCDLYVTTRQGRLLLVACHENDVIGNERTIWLPDTLEKTPGSEHNYSSPICRKTVDQ